MLQTIKAFLALPTTKLVAFVVVLVISLTLVLTFQFLPNRLQLKEGEVSYQTAKSPARTTFVSQLKTNEARTEAESKVSDVLVYDANITGNEVTKAQGTLKRIASIREDVSLSPLQKTEALQRLEGVKLSADVIPLIMGLDGPSWEGVVTDTVQSVGQSMRSRIPSDQVESAKARLAERIDETMKLPHSVIVSELSSNFIVANVRVDKGETERARNAAREAVSPVIITVEKDETILRDGEIVRPLDLEKLEAVGLLDSKVKWESILGASLLSLLISLMLGLYIRHFDPRLLVGERKLALLALLVVGAALAAKLTLPGRPLWAYLFPTAVVPMLVVTLLDAHLAVIVAAFLSVLIGYIAGGSFEIVVINFVSCLVGLFGIWRAQRINRFFLAGVMISLANFLGILGFKLLSFDPEFSRMPLYFFLSTVNGGLSSALTVGTFSLLGHFSGITTSLHLLELAQPNQPLLRRLLMEAPGTYHHSVIVGNLAERAAETIGADSLLVRVGAYYHDIGKIPRAMFFSENQIAGENIHDRLDPLTSARIISSHVKEGIALTKKQGIPNSVRDLILEHHGTRMVSYFYQVASKEKEVVDIADFQYPGPRPRSKEAGILMLADSVEAAVRSSNGLTTEKIDELVSKIVAERLAEGQLDECDLTFKDLELVKGAFKGILNGVFHPRVPYPELLEKTVLK